mgnify:CR=1 FL=1
MTVSDSATVVVNAPFDEVLAFLRDIDRQKTWFPDNAESEVLERDDEGRCLKAQLANDVKVAKDRFVLNYEHNDSGFSWRLAEPTLVQKTQQGSYTLTAKGQQTQVTMTLAVDTTLPLPGMIQKRIVKGTVQGATKALANQFR